MARWPCGGGSGEGEHAGDVDDGAAAAGEHPGQGGPGQHRRCDYLDVQQLARLLGREVGHRHVVGDTGVVDQHRQRSGCADVGHDVDPGVGGQVRDEDFGRDPRQ